MASNTAEMDRAAANKGKSTKKSPTGSRRRKATRTPTPRQVARRRKRRISAMSLDERLHKALNHPLRTEILAKLGEKAMSAKELEPVLDEPMTKIAYHCRTLLDYGFVEVAGKEQIRGAMKVKYRAITRMLLDGENWNRLSPETRNGISINAVDEVISRATDAIQGDTFDKRDERAVATFRMDADEEAWRQASEIVRNAYEQLFDVEAQAANRGGEKFKVTVSLLCYESPVEPVQAETS